MKRLRSWLFNFAAGGKRSALSIVFAVSALPFILACGGWIQSYLYGSSYGYYGIKPSWVGYEFGYMSNQGELVVRWRENLGPNESKVSHGVYMNVSPGYLIADWKIAPTGTVGNYPGRVWRVHGVAGARYWALAIVALVPMALPLTLTLVKRRRKRRRQHNLCLACGYDLRATPERCPECGMVPSTAKGAAT